MLRWAYEASAALFFLQIVLIPLLLIGFGVAWFRHTARLAALKTLLGWDRKRKEKRVSALLEAVPRLEPLTCAPCGSPMVLEEESARCIGCRTPAALPEDYRATRQLRRRLPRLAAAAIRHWRAARILTATPVRLLLWLMVFSPLLIFAVILIGNGRYPDAFADRALDRMGEGWALAIALAGIAGFILWMMVFGVMATLSKNLRRKLPAFPDLRAAGAAEPEFTTCEACGGGIGFGRGRLAMLCGYCTVPNFRAGVARRERGATEDHQARMRWSLFGAMEIIEPFIATVYWALVCLIFAAAVIGLFSLFAE